MINHKLKIIFIHIPKCAGSSIKGFYFDNIKLDWRVPNYDLLYGWCPKRRLHLQHATPKQLIETELVSIEDWNSYFKFTFIRNPWDRAYSDYLWIMKDRNIKGSFKNYIYKDGVFKGVFNDNTNMYYRGDHLLPQTDFVFGDYSLDFIGRFENLKKDIEAINKKINFSKEFNIHKNKSKNRHNHYSLFYTNSNKKLVDNIYKEDINDLNYIFQDMRRGIYTLKKLI